MSGYYEAEQGFRDFAAGLGYALPDVLREGADGFQRFRVDGDKAGERAGWCKWKYRPHDGSAWGEVGDWRTGECHVWRWRGEDGGQQRPRRYRPSPLALAEAQQQREAARREREQQQAVEYAQALQRMRTEWHRAPFASDGHAYCRAKAIEGHPLSDAPYNSPPLRLGRHGELLVPAYGFAADARWLELRGFQRIFPPDASGKSRKMNAKGCPLEGLFYPFGRAAGAYAGVLVLAEGWATAATVFDALGFDAAEPWQTLCCFGAKNMLAVAREAHARQPQRPILIAADADAAGMEAARAAAREVGGWIAAPHFPDGCPAKGTDFNDMARLIGTGGLEDVLRCIEDAREVFDDGEGAA